MRAGVRRWVAENRKEIARHGERGRWVRVVSERSTGLYRVQWKVPGQKMKTQSFREKATAKSFADGLAEQLRKGPIVRPLNLTMQQMWDRYVTAEFPHLRTNTKRIYTDNYRTWCLFFGWEFVAEHTTPEMADDLRTELIAKGLAINTVRKVIYDVKRVFAWAEARELIQRNRLRLYKFKVAKEDRPTPPPEYRADELAGILAQLDPANASQWRPWVALTLCGNQGARQHAVLHLEPKDCTERLITWQAEWDKNGVQWTQPMRPQSWLAVQVALAWREKLGYTGRWLIIPGRNSRWDSHPDATYTKDALWSALKDAESRAGIPRLERRGAHGFRRLLAGDVAALTGDPLMALRAIGDKDVRMAERYIQNRPDQVRDAFERLDRKAGEETPNALPKRHEGTKTGVTDHSATPATPNPEGLD
jgi:integrase